MPRTLMSYGGHSISNFYGTTLIEKISGAYNSAVSGFQTLKSIIKRKREIIKFLKTKGLDYYSTPIPEYTREFIIKKHPDDWEEFIKVY